MSREAFARSKEIARQELLQCQAIMARAAQDEFQLTQAEQKEIDVSGSSAARAIYWEILRKSIHDKALADCAKVYPAGQGV